VSEQADEGKKNRGAGGEERATVMVVLASVLLAYILRVMFVFTIESNKSDKVLVRSKRERSQKMESAKRGVLYLIGCTDPIFF
jgi:hypothetical protein